MADQYISEMLVYPAIIEPDGDYFMVTFPDIKYSTQGESLADAIKMAKDLLGGTLEPLRPEEYPVASLPSEIEVTGDQRIIYVDINMDEYRRKNAKTIRKNVTIPDYLDKMAKNANLNVSKVLTEALKTKLGV